MNARNMARCTCKAYIDQTLGTMVFYHCTPAFSMAALLHVDLKATPEPPKVPEPPKAWCNSCNAAILLDPLLLLNFLN